MVKFGVGWRVLPDYNVGLTANDTQEMVVSFN